MSFEPMLNRWVLIPIRMLWKTRGGDPRKPLTGPNCQKIARLAGMSHNELIGCRRKHLNTHYSGKRRKGDAFNRTEGNANAGDVLLD